MNNILQLKGQFQKRKAPSGFGSTNLPKGKTVSVDHVLKLKKQLQDIIFKVKNYPDDVIPNLVFYAICKECGILPDSITNAEMTRIQNAIKGQTLKILKIFDIINT